MPEGDLGTIIEAAVTEKLERIEARRFARTKKPRKTVADTDTTPSSRRIPAAIRRTVHLRDEGRCTFRDANGRRCSERERLELHHLEPYGRGGGHGVENLRLVCKAHNAYYAEKDYGKDVMERYRSRGDRAREPAPAYSVRTELAAGVSPTSRRRIADSSRAWPASGGRCRCPGRSRRGSR